MKLSAHLYYIYDLSSNVAASEKHAQINARHEAKGRAANISRSYLKGPNLIRSKQLLIMRLG